MRTEDGGLAWGYMNNGVERKETLDAFKELKEASMVFLCRVGM